jgi:hypothetical protein
MRSEAVYDGLLAGAANGSADGFETIDAAVAGAEITAPHMLLGLGSAA